MIKNNNWIDINATRKKSTSDLYLSKSKPGNQINLFPAINEGIQKGFITIPSGGVSSNLYTADGNTGVGLRTVTNGGGIKFEDPNYLDNYIKIVNDTDNQTSNFQTQYLEFQSYSDFGFPPSSKSRIGITQFGDLVFDSEGFTVFKNKLALQGSELLVTNCENFFIVNSSNETGFQFFNHEVRTGVQNITGRLVLSPTESTFKDNIVGKQGVKLIGFGENNNDDTGSTADYTNLVNTSLVPKRYVDVAIAASSSPSIYTANGSTGNTLRTVVNPAGIRFDDINYPSTVYMDFHTNYDSPLFVGGIGYLSGIHFYDDNDLGGGVAIGVTENGEFEISGDSGVTINTPLSVSAGTNSSTINNNGCYLNASTGGEIKIQPFGDIGIQIIDKSTNKKGVRLSGFGETGSTSDLIIDDEFGTANYSTLVSTSLVPKRYVDDEIAFYNADKIEEVNTATYSIVGAYATYHVTAAGSTLTIQTSIISDGNVFRIKDAIGNASVNNIVIQTQGAELIDGDGAGVTINTDYGYVELYCFNGNLFIKQ